MLENKKYYIGKDNSDNMNISIKTIKTPKEKIKRLHTICIGRGPLTVDDFRRSIKLNMDQKTFEDLIKNTNSCKEDRLAFSNREKAESVLLILTMLLNR